MKEELLSGVARAFALSALHTGVRVDGRPLEGARAARIDLGPAYGQARVSLGRTVAVASAAAVPTAPPSDRPAEGTLAVAVEVSPAASENAALEFAVHGTNPSSDKAAVRLRAVIERVIRDSRAIDTEALCILAGKKVWSVSVDVTVIDAAGNSLDAAHLAAMAALLHARRNDVSISGTEVHVHPFSEREPLPLPVHHVPLTASYALFGATPEFPDDIAVLDPSLQEELASDGMVTIALNAHGEVCGLHKAGGLPVDPKLVGRCAHVAEGHVVNLTKILKNALHDSSSKHHPLAAVRPVLVASEPTAIFRDSPTATNVDGDVVDAPMKDVGNNLQRGLSSWNAIPAEDASPPVLPESVSDATNSTVADRASADLFRASDKSLQPKSSQSQDTTNQSKTPSSRGLHELGISPAKTCDADAVNMLVDDSSDSDESDDGDLMAAYIAKVKGSTTVGRRHR